MRVGWESLRALPLAVALAAPGASAAAAAAELPAVVVDYNLTADDYRVAGDVSLLSQRYTPGSTFNLIIAAVALESGDLTEAMEIPSRPNGGDPARTVSLTLARALRESNDDFFSQLTKRTGYDAIRRLLVTSRYTTSVPEVVGSFGDLARGEPLRVTVFEQNLFLQAFLRRSLPLSPDTCQTLERSMAVEAEKPAWGRSGIGELSPEPPRYISWFNGVARLRDGPHVITIAVLTTRPDPAALDRFRRYVSRRRR